MDVYLWDAQNDTKGNYFYSPIDEKVIINEDSTRGMTTNDNSGASTS